MKRILFVSCYPCYPVYENGATLRIYFQLVELQRKHKVDLVIIVPDEDIEENSDLIKKLPNVNFVCVKESEVYSRWRFYRYDIKKLKSLLQKLFCENNSYDLFICEQGLIANCIQIVDAKTNIVNVVDCNSLAAFRQSRIKYSIAYRLKYSFLALYYFVFELVAYRNFDIIYVVSKDDKKALRFQCKNDRVHVLPNGYSPIDFYNKHQDRDYKFGFFANIRAPMNKEFAIFLLEIFIRLADRNTSERYIIAGRGANILLTDYKNIPSNIDIIDGVSDPCDLLNNIEYYISQIEFGTGIKNNVIQAGACGCKLILNNQVFLPLKKYLQANFQTVERIKTMRILTDILLSKADYGKIFQREIEDHLKWEQIISKMIDD
jgi:glycosyltransferase involved in cell wall biosynthesis